LFLKSGPGSGSNQKTFSTKRRVRETSDQARKVILQWAQSRSDQTFRLFRWSWGRGEGQEIKEKRICKRHMREFIDSIRLTKHGFLAPTLPRCPTFPVALPWRPLFHSGRSASSSTSLVENPHIRNTKKEEKNNQKRKRKAVVFACF
jgi:hypothetical protein